MLGVLLHCFSTLLIEAEVCQSNKSSPVWPVWLASLFWRPLFLPFGARITGCSPFLPNICVDFWGSALQSLGLCANQVWSLNHLPHPYITYLWGVLKSMSLQICLLSLKIHLELGNGMGLRVHCACELRRPTRHPGWKLWHPRASVPILALLLSNITILVKSLNSSELPFHPLCNGDTESNSSGAIHGLNNMLINQCILSIENYFYKWQISLVTVPGSYLIFKKSINCV